MKDAFEQLCKLLPASVSDQVSECIYMYVYTLNYHHQEEFDGQNAMHIERLTVLDCTFIYISVVLEIKPTHLYCIYNRRQKKFPFRLRSVSVLRICRFVCFPNRFANRYVLTVLVVKILLNGGVWALFVQSSLPFRFRSVVRNAPSYANGTGTFFWRLLYNMYIIMYCTIPSFYFLLVFSTVHPACGPIRTFSVELGETRSCKLTCNMSYCSQCVQPGV